jgi:hypothetical protein
MYCVTLTGGRYYGVLSNIYRCLALLYIVLHWQVPPGTTVTGAPGTSVTGAPVLQWQVPPVLVTGAPGTMEDSSLLTLLISVFSWSTLYFTLCLLDSKRSYEWHCRMVTVLHAVSISALSAWCVLVQGPWPFTHAGELYMEYGGSYIGAKRYATSRYDTYRGTLLAIRLTIRYVYSKSEQCNCWNLGMVNNCKQDQLSWNGCQLE